MQKKQLYYNWNWTKLPKDQIPHVIREFLDNGADHFVFTSLLLKQALENPDWIGELKRLEHEFNIKFGAMHTLFGGDMALNHPDKTLRPEMLEKQIRSLQIASEFEVKTFTVHSDAYHYVHLHYPVETLRPFFQESLEILLKHAEKYGIVIAIENNYEKPNSAKEITAIAKPYAGSPCLGFCYDTGHANIMVPAAWKNHEMYSKNTIIPISGRWPKNGGKASNWKPMRSTRCTTALSLAISTIITDIMIFTACLSTGRSTGQP